MRRRSFLSLAGALAVTWPNVAFAQQRVRRIGVLHATAADSPDAQRRRILPFVAALQLAGWIDGTNIRIDYRWSAGDPTATRRYAEELVALAPDAIVCSGAATVAPLSQLTRSVPIVF